MVYSRLLVFGGGIATSKLLNCNISDTLAIYYQAKLADVNIILPLINQL